MEAGWLAKGLGVLVWKSWLSIGVELPSQPASSVLKARIFVTPRILWRGPDAKLFFHKAERSRSFPLKRLELRARQYA